MDTRELSEIGSGCNEFNAQLTESKHLHRRLNDERLCSAFSLMNLKLDVASEGTGRSKITSAMRLQDGWFDTRLLLLLQPSVQNAWNRRQLADWLIKANVTDEVRRSSVQEDLRGRIVVFDFTKEALSKEDVAIWKHKLRRRVQAIAAYAWEQAKDENGLKKGLCDFFETDFDKLHSQEELEYIIMKKWAPMTLI